MGDFDLELFCQHEYGRLVGTLTVYCGDQALAEELAQEALARAWAHWPKVSRLDNPAGWLYRVAFNLSQSHFRRKRVERRARERVARPEAPAEIDAADARMALATAITRLPKRQRTVVVLHYYLDYSLIEIADLLDLPPTTVRSQAARARQRLRRELEPPPAKETGYVT